MTDIATRATMRGPECRAFPVALELRDGKSGGAPGVVGYASTTESPYEMQDMFGAYTEVISRGAFARTLGQTPKVQLLVNHGGMSLAATTAGTLRLSEDETGLHFDADLNPKRTDAADLIEALADGAVDECSFMFRVTRQQWSPDYDERRINEINLNRGDVSVVNLGANPNTPVAMRAADIDAYLDTLQGDALAEAIARLQKRVTPVTPVMSLDFARLL